LHIEWQVKIAAGSLHETDHLGGKLLETLIAADKLGARKLVLQVPDNRPRIVAQ
jgi:hypothetical protein